MTYINIINFDFSKKIQTNKCDIEKSKVWRNGFVQIFGMLLLIVFCILKY